MRITATAENDLVDIWTFIAQDDPQAANAFIYRIRERFQPLLSRPRLGPARDYLSPGLRAHFYRAYVIYYRFTEQEVIIMRVVHGSRDASALIGLDEE